MSFFGGAGSGLVNSFNRVTSELNAVMEDVLAADGDIYEKNSDDERSHNERYQRYSDEQENFHGQNNYNSGAINNNHHPQQQSNSGSRNSNMIVNQLEHELNLAHSENQKYVDRVSELEHLLRQMQARENDFRAQIQSSSSNNNNNNLQKPDLKTKISTDSNLTDDLNNIENLQQQLLDLEQMYEEKLKFQKQKFVEEKENLNTAINNLNEELAEASDIAENDRKEKNQLKGKIKDIESIKIELETVKNLKYSLENDLNLANQNSKETETNYKKLLAQTEEIVKSTSNENASLKNELTSLKNQLDSGIHQSQKTNLLDNRRYSHSRAKEDFDDIKQNIDLTVRNLEGQAESIKLNSDRTLNNLLERLNKSEENLKVCQNLSTKVIESKESNTNHEKDEELEKLKAELEQINLELSNNDEELIDANFKIEDLSQQINKLKSDNQDLSEKCNNYETLKSQNSTNLQNLADQISKLNNQLNKVFSEKNNLENQLITKNDEVSKISTKNHEIEANFSELSSRAEILDITVKGLNQKNDEIQSELDDSLCKNQALLGGLGVILNFY